VGTPEPPLPFRAVEAEILRDIDPVVLLIKDILHSDRWSPPFSDSCNELGENGKAVVDSFLMPHAF
jgi:hypothetical protein